MKTHLLILLISLFAVCSNSAMGQNRDLKQTANKMVEKWTQSLQLTTEQRALLLEKTIDYLDKRQEILKNVRNRKMLHQEQNNALRQNGNAYRKNIDLILTKEQKEKIEAKKEEEHIAIQNNVQNVVKEYQEKLKDNIQQPLIR